MGQPPEPRFDSIVRCASVWRLSGSQLLASEPFKPSPPPSPLQVRVCFGPAQYGSAARMQRAIYPTAPHLIPSQPSLPHTNPPHPAPPHHTTPLHVHTLRPPRALLHSLFPLTVLRSLMKSLYQVEVALVSLVDESDLKFLARAGEWPESILRAGGCGAAVGGGVCAWRLAWLCLGASRAAQRNASAPALGVAGGCLKAGQGLWMGGSVGVEGGQRVLVLVLCRTRSARPTYPSSSAAPTCCRQLL